MTADDKVSTAVSARIRRTVFRAWALSERFLRHPTWAFAHLRNFSDQLSDRWADPVAPPAPTHSLTGALALIGGVDATTVPIILESVPQPRLYRESVLYGNPNASRELVSLTYACARLLRPDVVVETGVANGYTTGAILAALDENDKGTLLSFDLPHLHPDAEESVGAAVDPALQARWTLHMGPAAPTLRRVLPGCPPVDIVVQDAAHTVRGQLAEYRAAWPFLKSGGLLISDDVGPGFVAFAADVGQQALYVGQDKPSPIGILVKHGKRADKP